MPKFVFSIEIGVEVSGPDYEFADEQADKLVEELREKIPPLLATNERITAISISSEAAQA